MTWIPYAALLTAFALIYAPRVVVAREMAKLAGGYDNHDIRGQQTQLTGLGKRALGAHNNGFEAFAPFAAGVLAAAQRGVAVNLVAGLAVAFIVLRVVYIAMYLGDRAALRTTIWTLGMLCSAALLALALRG
jgi:uncharacterized MAPEG superfamily protein